MARKVEDEGGIFERQGCGNVIYGKAIWENKKMNNIKHALYLKIIKAADALMLTVPFLLCWFFYYADRFRSIFGGIGLSPPCFCSSMLCSERYTTLSWFH